MTKTELIDKLLWEIDVIEHKLGCDELVSAVEAGNYDKVFEETMNGENYS